MVGDITKAINAQNVLLSVGTEGEVVTLYNIRHSKESILDRRNTRGGAIDTPTYILEEIIADATISQDLYNHFNLIGNLNGRGVLTSESFIITGEAANAGDDVSYNGNYVLRRMEDIAQEQGRYEVTLTMRVVPVPPT